MNNTDIEILLGLTEILANHKTYTGEDYRVYNALDRVFNEERWITIHPHGKDEKGQPLLVKDGESPKEVIEKLNYKLPEDLEKTFKNWDNKVKLEFSKKYIDSGIFSKEILDKARQKYKNFDNLSIQLKSSILDDFGRKSAEKYFKQVINSNPDYKKWSVLSDIYSALTMGRDNKDKFLGKHSQEYWEDANFGLKIGKSANINSEIFANYVEMRMGNFTEQLKYLKDNEPKLYNKLDLLYNKVATEIEKL